MKTPSQSMAHLRKKAGLTQRALAKAVGAPQPQVCRYETTGTWPRNPHVLAAYLKALGVQP